MTGPDQDTPGGVYSQTGAHAFVPIWILNPAVYLPGADPAQLRKGDDKPLSGSEIRVYVALRSFADRYSGHAFPFVKTIAERAGVHPHSVEKALSKFRRLGWMTTQRRYRDDGSIRRCDYYLVDVCPNSQAGGYPRNGGEGMPANSRGGYPQDDGEGARDMTGASNTPREHPTGTPQGSDQDCPEDVRSAHIFGANEDDQESEPEPDDTAAGSDWRAEDREWFRAVVGDKLRIVGPGWNPPEGTFPALAFYNVFRKRKRKQVRWPGKLLNDIYARRAEDGVDDWLIDEGLERVA